MARLHREKLAALLEGIARGNPPAGTMLPREVALAADFHVSRGVVREMIRALEERGVVTVKHGRGATVRPLEEWNVFDPLVLRAVLASRASRKVLLELTECRTILEVGATRLAAQRASDSAVAEIVTAVNRLAALATSAPADRGRAELAIHRRIVTATGNTSMMRMVIPVLDAMDVASDVLGRRGTSHDEHSRIAGALERGDGELAASAMRDHLDAVAEFVRRRRTLTVGP